MESIKVGIRDFRENLATYLLKESPVTITRNGDIVGYFIPARPKRTEADREALREAAARLHAWMDAAGVTEEDLVADFKRLRAGRRQ